MTQSLTFVRHGETEGQSSIRYHGRTDVPLSALGRAQMMRVRDALAVRQFTAVYASRLSRSVDAAAIVGRTDAAIRVPGFDEIDFGEWEGMTAEEIQARDPESYRRWTQTDGEFRYPGGESVTELRTRVARALGELLAANSGDLLVVVHKGVIRAALAELLRLDDHQRRALAVPLASIHVIHRTADGWRAEILDRTDHL
jgi:broad specificity phosphatase PhoE